MGKYINRLYSVVHNTCTEKVWVISDGEELYFTKTVKTSVRGAPCLFPVVMGSSAFWGKWIMQTWHIVRFCSISP